MHDSSATYGVVKPVDFFKVPPQPARRLCSESDEQLFNRLLASYGPPAHRNKEGKLSQINERFWAEFLASERIIIHERDEETFYVYAPPNGLYETQTAHAIKAALSDRIRRADREWSQCSGLTRFDTEPNRRNIISLLRGVVEERDFFANRPRAIHTQNYMIVFEGGKPVVKPFSPEFRSRNQLAVHYDPLAQCPRFEKELLAPAMSANDVKLVQKMLGIFLEGVNRPQRILILSGAADTGKTTLGLIVLHLIGRRNYVELRTDLLGERFEMSRALGKTLYFGPDVDAHFLQSKGAHRLKSIVGNDPMDAELKHSNDHFPFEGIINVLITSNSRLIVRLQGDYEAWRRRLAIIDYNGKPPAKRIQGLDQILFREEGSGILNYAIAGLMAYEKDCLADGDIKLYPEQKNRITALLSESDGLRRFVKSELVKSDKGDLTVEELIEGYAVFAKEKDWQPLPLHTIQTQLRPDVRAVESGSIA